jgi:hypothetical protein
LQVDLFLVSLARLKLKPLSSSAFLPGRNPELSHVSFQRGITLQQSPLCANRCHPAMP